MLGISTDPTCYISNILVLALRKMRIWTYKISSFTRISLSVALKKVVRYIAHGTDCREAKMS